MKTPASKVPESDFDPRFWADIKDQFGWSRLLAGASMKIITEEIHAILLKTDCEKQFVTEEACRLYLEQLKWPDGLRCP
jgi:hypothetical protein